MSGTPCRKTGKSSIPRATDGSTQRTNQERTRVDGLQAKHLDAMFFTRMQETPCAETREGIYADKPIPHKESICDICRNQDKKLLDPLAKRQRTGKRRWKRPQRSEWIRYTDQWQLKKQIAWANADEGT